MSIAAALVLWTASGLVVAAVLARAVDLWREAEPMDQATSDERTRTIATLYGNHQAAAELTVRDFYAAHVLASIAQHYPVAEADAADVDAAEDAADRSAQGPAEPAEDPFVECAHLSIPDIGCRGAPGSPAACAG